MKNPVPGTTFAPPAVSRRVVLCAVPALLLPPSVRADAASDPGAQEIMEKNFFASKLRSIQVESVMLLLNAKGEKREHRSTNLVKLQPNGIDSKFVVRFSFPNDIKGLSFLQVEHSDADDDLWIYLPALKKSRRLVANNKKDSFAGSDFSYGDILLPKVSLYRHTLLRSEPVEGRDCFVVESLPASDAVKSSSGYTRKITWVRKDSFVEAKVEYYDLSGQLLKTQRITDHELIEPDTQRWFARGREMVNHRTGHKTVIQVEKLQPGVPAPDELFTTRYIERE